MKNLRRKLTKKQSKERVDRKGYLNRKDSKIYGDKENKIGVKITDKKKLMRKVTSYMYKRLSGVIDVGSEMEEKVKTVFDEKCLDEDMPPRYLVSENPNAPKVLVNYDHAAQKLVMNELLDQLVVHFEYDGHTILRDSEEHKIQEEILEKRDMKIQEVIKQHDLLYQAGESGQQGFNVKVARKILRNKFNYSERQTQTSNLILKSRGVSTAKPHLLNFSGEVNQSIIFDAYFGDVQKNKRQLSRADSDSFARRQMKKTGDSQKDLKKKDGVSSIYSASFQKCLKTMERMIVQNSEKEKYHDFKYMFTGDKTDPAIGSDALIYPLWRFTYTPNKKNHVTSIAWNPKFK